jgi:hypothetical protein
MRYHVVWIQYISTYDHLPVGQVERYANSTRVFPCPVSTTNKLTKGALTVDSAMLHPRRHNLSHHRLSLRQIPNPRMVLRRRRVRVHSRIPDLARARLVRSTLPGMFLCRVSLGTLPFSSSVPK